MWLSRKTDSKIVGEILDLVLVPISRNLEVEIQKYIDSLQEMIEVAA